MSNLSIPNGIQSGRMLSFAGTKLQMLKTTSALCLEEYQQRRVDTVSGTVSAVSGITNIAFSISLLFRLFLLVYRSFLLK